MAFTVDMSGLVLLEEAVAALQAQQSASPSGFTGGQSFGCSYKAGVPGAQPSTGLAVAGSTPSTLTVAQLTQRIQSLLLAVQQLPQ
jgi:hypothetical protein